MSVFRQFSLLSRLFLKGNPRANQRIPIGVVKHKSQVLFFSQPANRAQIQRAIGIDNYSFNIQNQTWFLPPEFSTDRLRNLQVIEQAGKKNLFFQAGKSSYLAEWQEQKLQQPVEIPEIRESAISLSNGKIGDKSIMFVGDRAIRLASSTDLLYWEIRERPILATASPTRAAAAAMTEHGILLLYYQTQIRQNQLQYSAHLALLDKDQPEKVLWLLPEPIWQQTNEWQDQVIEPVGAFFDENHFVSYWWVDHKILQVVKHTGFLLSAKKITSHKKVTIEKHVANPLISPNQHHDWESFTTFNPSAVYVNDQVHILYRAQGYDYVSSIGYAISDDGFSINQQFEKPIYEPTRGFETNATDSVNPFFMSGGGFGGCEDPRVTIIDDRVYMIYVAFDGWSPPRLAMTSLSLENFLKKRWLWTKPVLISPPGIVDKSGCLFPEKIHGKYVFLHRVFPNILIDYVDDLNFDEEEKWLVGQDQITIRPNYWDSRKIGAGAPPLKTADGWLLIYYGVDDKDAGKYHVGAMLLDLENPAKVLYRSNQPILQPEEKYEWEGFKPGVAYPCGAVIIDGKLFVYYGAADQVVCVATVKLDTFLADLKSQSIIHWESFPVREVEEQP